MYNIWMCFQGKAILLICSVLALLFCSFDCLHSTGLSFGINANNGTLLLDEISAGKEVVKPFKLSCIQTNSTCLTFMVHFIELIMLL